MIFSVELSEDKSMLVSASDDRSIRVWIIPPEWRKTQRSVLIFQHACLLGADSALSFLEWKNLVACWCSMATQLASGLQGFFLTASSALERTPLVECGATMDVLQTSSGATKGNAYGL